MHCAFPRYLIKGTILGKGRVWEGENYEHKMWVGFLYNLAETFLILRRIQRHIIINVNKF